jgi:carbon-monoxide dehydrogenase medium subunit
MRLRAERPKLIVDVNRLDDLAYLERRAEHVAVGALTRQEHARRADLSPLVNAALQSSGFKAVRNRATVGGALADAESAGDFAVAFLALNGSVVASSLRGGERSIEAADLFVANGRTALAPSELLTEVRLPHWEGCSFAFHRATGGVGAWRAIVNTAVVLSVSNGRIDRVAIAIGGTGPTPVRAQHLERLLEGAEPSLHLIEHAAAETTVAHAATSDASGAHRQHLARVLVRRALVGAMLE